MKKIIYISTILISLLLSSCDIILDAVYPQPTRNNIDINLNIDSSITTNNIKFYVIPFKNRSMVFSEAKTISITKKSSIDYTIKSLPNNVYLLFAFSDTNYDDKPGMDEPSIQLFKSNSFSIEEIFDFSKSDVNEEVIYKTSYELLNSSSRIRNDYLREINGLSKLNTDYTIYFPGIMTPTENKTITYPIYFNDENAITLPSGSAEFYISYNNISSRIYPQYIMDENSIDINFNSFEHYNGDKLLIKTKVPFKDGINTVYRTKEFDIEFKSVDLGFTFATPTYLSRINSNYSSLNIQVYPNDPTKVIESIDWIITDDFYLNPGYNSNKTVNTVFSKNFNINLALLNENLASYWWDNRYMKLTLTVYYIDGTQFTNIKNIYLY